MAVINDWVDSAVAAGKRGASAKVAGSKTVALAGSFEVAAADDDGSIYRLAKIPSNAIFVSLLFNTDALTSGTSWDVGFYKENGVVADKDLLAAALDFSSASGIGSEKNGLTNVGGADPIAAIGKRLWELLALTAVNKEEAYILALTANTVGSAAGTISYRGTYILG